MVSADTPVGAGWGSIERSPAQTRILDAALGLIGQHGVNGTSLQMIADAIGVTKAAVYRQFKAKDDIVVALTERELGKLEAALLDAEAETSGRRARKILLASIVDLAVKDRQAASALQFDPVVIRMLAEHPPFQQFLTRLYGVLIGNAFHERWLPTVMMAGAIGTAVTHPLTAELDDDTLRDQLLYYTRRFIEVVEERA